MYYVEIMKEGRKRTAVAVQELVVTSDEYIRVVKEIDF